MRVSRFRPSSALAPFIKVFTVVEAEEETLRTLMPDTGLILGVRYRGAARELSDPRRLPHASLTGMRASVRHMLTEAGSGVVLATFREGMASAFFEGPLNELYGQTASLEDFVPARFVSEVTTRMEDLRRLEDRVDVVQSWLMARLHAERRDPVAIAAAREIAAAHGSLRIDVLARRLSVSRDRLEKRFRRSVGTTPKHLASLHRLHYALGLHRAGISWTEIAVQAGYFDQAHLIRMFRGVTGQAPRAFFRSTDPC